MYSFVFDNLALISRPRVRAEPARQTISRHDFARDMRESTLLTLRADRESAKARLKSRARSRPNRAAPDRFGDNNDGNCLRPPTDLRDIRDQSAKCPPIYQITRNAIMLFHFGMFGRTRVHEFALVIQSFMFCGKILRRKNTMRCGFNQNARL